MDLNIIALCGWVTVIVFPTATLIQLYSIIKSGTTNGVSASAWFLFGIANICLYVYTEKYTEPQSIVGLLGTALVDFIIVFLVLIKYEKKHIKGEHSSEN